MRFTPLVRPSLGVALAIFAPLLISPAVRADYTVPGTSDPYLSGMPNGSTASSGDIAPDQSPILVDCLITGGQTFTFGVTGSVNYFPGPSGMTPDGGFLIGHSGGNNNIGDAVVPVNSLVGVFLDANQPDATPLSVGLNFGVIGTSFSSLSPGLKQVFFIGDGLTGTGTGSVQQFIAPAGATRLYLGTGDGFGWYNNSGSFDVAVDCTAVVPEPGAVVTGIALMGGLGLGLLRGRRRK